MRKQPIKDVAGDACALDRPLQRNRADDVDYTWPDAGLQRVEAKLKAFRLMLHCASLRLFSAGSLFLERMNHSNGALQSVLAQILKPNCAL